MAMDSTFKPLIGGALAMGVLASVVLLTIAIVNGYKNTGQVDNTTADKFVTGIIVFATFVGIMALAVVGKAVMKIMTSNK